MSIELARAVVGYRASEVGGLIGLGYADYVLGEPREPSQRRVTPTAPTPT